MKPLGLGFVGLHHQHPRWYSPLWDHLPEYKLLAMADSDEEFLEAENRFFRLDTHRDYRELLERGDIDVVILWLPHSQMPRAVAQAARAGKHVIVEKPCAADLAGALKIAEIARQYPEIKISSPYCWRNHPVSARIKQAFDSGLLGEITAMEGRLNAGGPGRYLRDHSPWILHAEEGGGPMWNLGVHWIDYFRWLTGREIVDVKGVVNGPIGEPPRNIEDNAQALLTFENGAIAMLDISYSLPDNYPAKRDIYLSLRGTQGALAWQPAWEGNVDELLLVSKTEGKEQSERIAIPSRPIPGYGGHMGWAWLNDFAEAVRHQRQPQVTVEDIVAAVKVVDAFYASCQARSAK